ncbi:calcium-binding protein [Nocardioides sp. Root151]|uniref:calcium-binding protein n=1 Tax=Nocardioides sp. Root151 TaxID=1736475 RepID=UPI0007032FB5|nr:calcium-binding protein [Nocardioides sp. Root151]KQZ67446.1 hypothetical protein ASD66_21130 [Nocardioides sp. Root151]
MGLNLAARMCIAGGVALTGAFVVPLAAPATAAPHTCHGLRATIVGTPGNDTINGTRHRDVIVGLAGHDVINGGAGDDVICGDVGADRLDGGAGNDRLYGGQGAVIDDYDDVEGPLPNDVLRGGPGDDVLQPGTSTTYNLDKRITYSTSATAIRANLATGVVTGEGRDRVPTTGRFEFFASPHDDVVQGSGRNDKIWGGSGDDVIRAGAGDDSLGDGTYNQLQRADRDLLDGQGGNDSLMGSKGHDTLLGGDGNDYLDDHGAGVDRLLGGAGNDEIWDVFSRGTSQEVDGGPGKNLLTFEWTKPGAGDPTYTRLVMNLATGASNFVGEGAFTVRNVTDVQAFLLSRGSWTVTGTAAAERFRAGRSLRLIARGGGGDDVLEGGALDDVISGGAGRDQAYVGPGRDTCTSVERVTGPACEIVS